MKSWAVSDVRWANERDLHLPFWADWNRKNPLPGNFWQQIWEYPYLCSRIPSSSKCLDVGGTYPFVLFPNFPEAVSVDRRDLNALDHPLHKGKWPKDRLVVCDAADIDLEDDSFDYAFSVSAIEEMPDMLSVIKEMLRLARHRVVITLDVSDELGVSQAQLRELEAFLNVRIPPLPSDSLNSTSPVLSKFGQKRTGAYKHIRVLGVTIDARDEPRSVGILIPHWESWEFLRFCLEAIRENRNRRLAERVYVLDDASKDGSYEKARERFTDDNIEFHRFERPNKEYDADIGLLLDHGLKLVKEQYVVSIDADLIPLDRDWITFPIWLVERYGCSSVGLDTGLSPYYLRDTRSQVWWQPEDGYLPGAGVYDNEWFTCTNNLYRVMPTALAKVVSESIGFSKGNVYSASGPRWVKLKNIINRRARSLNVNIDGRYPYLLAECDNGVAANHFIDINRMGPKFNIPLTSYIGLTPHDGAFGQNICGLAFHFALSTRALSSSRREVEDAGEPFRHWVRKLRGSKGMDSETIKEMIEASTHFQPGGYDGSIPASWYEREFEYIQGLLREFGEKK